MFWLSRRWIPLAAALAVAGCAGRQRRDEALPSGGGVSTDIWTAVLELWAR